ncbi:phosphoribosylformylglycinamidine cyclo-ligase [uncultured Intestinimonas sp.]|uniref:phosphoribosylformylglycinamidine cyclo-ligase n=1 Tax=uncultured Intestinimonas sp. TaxID=1689265 RepID=UPI0025DFDA61|nr:phosphoribosylformylglycinamidine cyclo-ligase [uncultured Intestinimonas sp.]
MKNSHSESYKAAGVDVTAGYEAVDRIKPLVESTYIPGVMGTLGGFGGLFAPDLTGLKKPVLVSGTDGVGTKLKLAFLMDKHDTVGIDCVAMCVNDIVCSGARPLFFLDYLAVGKNLPERVEAIVSGVVEGCRQAGCALIGGETAEMPGFYPENEYDLAGFAVGLADQEKMLDGSTMEAGDLLLGLGSSGVHSNGFSLVRKALNINEAKLAQSIPELGCTLGEELLKPTRIYVKAVECLLHHGIHVRAISHITGGGLYENVPRMMKPGLTARIEISSYPVPAIFGIIAKEGHIPERDMYNTFNMGVGLVLAIPRQEVGRAKEVLCRAGERAYIIGSVVQGEAGVELV